MTTELTLERPLFEDENSPESEDPDETPIKDRRLVTQPYDLVIESLIDQIKNEVIHLRPLSERPKFQRRYIWPDRLASRLIESILLNIPIPPCYLSQNEEFEMDAIDGQQRLYSIYRFMDNQLPLSGLEVLKEFNKKRFHDLPNREQRKLATHTLRCIVITNDSHPEIKFDVFERLNTNTAPLNAQELRNCIYRGALNDLLGELAGYKAWLSILKRSNTDKRLRDEELILRFFAFYLGGVESYRTPQKHWLNSVAKSGQKYNAQKIDELAFVWRSTVDKCLIIFPAIDCFRRSSFSSRSAGVINRALMDLTMSSLSDIPIDKVPAIAPTFRERYSKILSNEDFDDLISRAIDHKSRTLRRFSMWQEYVLDGLL